MPPETQAAGRADCRADRVGSARAALAGRRPSPPVHCTLAAERAQRRIGRRTGPISRSRGPPLPAVKRSGLACAIAVDAFVLAKLEAAGLTPSPQADRRTLIRRADASTCSACRRRRRKSRRLSADDSPDAYERLVDRLLASPRYGERWGRHWLDVARYADTKGYAFPQERQLSLRLHLPRLRDPRAQRRPALRPVHRRAARRRPACRRATTSRRWPRSGFLTAGRKFNNRNDDIDDQIDVVDARPAGPDRRLRPLPRPQVRRDSDRGLLLAVRRLRQLRRAGRAAADRARRRIRPSIASFEEELEQAARRGRQVRRREAHASFSTRRAGSRPIIWPASPPATPNTLLGQAAVPVARSQGPAAAADRALAAVSRTSTPSRTIRCSACGTSC